MGVNLVGFCGLAGSGKTTAAVCIDNLIRFSDPLKAMLYAIGLNYNEIQGHLKNEPCARLCGRTPRYAMQTLGTDWGRDMIGPDLWVNLWVNAVRKVLGGGETVCADDVRFPDEAAALRGLGGKLIRIERPGVAGLAVGGDHPSETQTLDPDFTIVNYGSAIELWGAVDQYMRAT